MAINEITRESILAAIREFDEIGRVPFLEKYGFGRSYLYLLEHEGRQYDSKAIVGAAHRIQFPEQPMPNFGGGDPTKRVLDQNGFNWVALGPRRRLNSSGEDEEQTVWVFQYSPDRFDLLADFQKANDSVQWSMNQHHADARQDDWIYFYRSGSQAGIVARGFIVSDGAYEAETPDEFGRWKVDVEYDALVETPLSRAELQSDPLLANVRVFQGQQGTNFPLATAEWRRIDELVEDRLVFREVAALSIRDQLHEFMSGYVKARSEPLAGHPAYQQLQALRDGLMNAGGFGDEQIVARCSVGAGNWSQVPWIAFLDRRETKSTTQGVYPVYLFRADMSAVYLTLAQGVTQLIREHQRPGARRLMAEKASAIQARLTGALPGFSFDRTTVDLRGSGQLADDYESSVITYRMYEFDALPDDEVLTADLRKLALAYEAYIDGNTGAPDLLLVGADRGVDTTAAEYAQTIREHGRVASWWSFPISPAIEEVLRGHPYLYIYVGQPRQEIAFRYHVSEWRTQTGSTGLVSPWPDVTPEAYRGLTTTGGDKATIFKTWFLIDAVEPLDPAVPLAGYEDQDGEPAHPSPGGFQLWRRRLTQPAPPPLSMEWLVAETLWPQEQLNELIDAIREQGGGQVILAGPPGTGKTWVARSVARYLTNDRAHSHRIVQFHPSSSYEEFIEGLRPIAENNAIKFERKNGVVLDMAEEVASGQLSLLVIDEMNRANLPRVFGELMYLFEYRDQPIDLQYSRGFRLPRELKFLGTMNTADRSIRSIDIALRRRFEVFECPPDPGILERYYQAHTNEVVDLIEGFAKLNADLTERLDRHHTIGHTFFMHEPMTADFLRVAWQRRIGPLLEEYFFDQPDVAAEFKVGKYWSSLA